MDEMYVADSGLFVRFFRPEGLTRKQLLVVVAVGTESIPSMVLLELKETRGLRVPSITLFRSE